MSLTEQEKEWLETRKNLCGRCEKRKYCRVGKRHSFNTETCKHWKLTAPAIESWQSQHDDYEDAARFEARVQKRLMYQYEKVFHVKEVSGGFMPNRQTMLMFARIDAEQEIEQEEKR